MSKPVFILHATPPLQGLPASDRESIYLAGLLALGSPGQWGVVTAAWSENGGKIPYLIHRGHHVRPRHLASLPHYDDPDRFLGDKERADGEVWKAYIEGTLVDLVYHTLYSLPGNHPLLAQAQTANTGYLERHYVSQRIKGIHKARLIHVGLWGLGGLDEGEATDEDRKRLEEAFIIGPAGTQAPRAWAGWKSGRELEKRRRLWGEEELSTRIKAALDPLVRRLGEGSYFFGQRPASVDIALFATLTLILTPTFPNALFSNHLHAYYPRLVAHHNRTLGTLFGSYDSLPRIPSPPRPTLWESARDWWRGEGAAGEGEGDRIEKKKKKSDKEIAFERGRWLWFAAAGIAMVGYVLASGLVRIELGGGEEEEGLEIDEVEFIEDDDEEDDDEGEEEEEEEEDEDEKEEEDEDEDEEEDEGVTLGEGETDSPLAAFTEDEDDTES